MKKTKEKEEVARLYNLLMLVLDQVDYTNGACRQTEMVGAVLPKVIIDQARNGLKESKKLIEE